MNELRKWQYQRIAREMVEVLKQKHYDAIYAEDLQEARKLVLDMIPRGASIALGGSVTINDMDVIDTFRKGEYRLFDRYQKGLTHEQVVEIFRQSLLADFLLTGTNAITRQGELVNVDCSGNRVAAMIYGPKRVVIVAGANKVVDNLEDAMKRLKQIAPLNAKRIGHRTPCTETGKCMDCQVHDRMCNYITIINNGWKYEGRISIILVAEETGF